MTGSRQHERGSAQHWHRLLLAVAVVIRARSYLSARPLSHDEAALALNILERPFAHLLDRLDYTQAAPLGFLYLTKLATLTFGTGEHALRLLPFAASVGSVFLLFAVAKRLLPPSGVSAALALFAVSGPLVDYGVELKPYAVDACLTLALLLAFWTHAPPTNLSSTLRLGALGTAAVWLSYPAVFVLAGLGTPVLVDCLRRRDWKGLASIGGASMFWIANAAWLYLVSARPMATNPRVVRYWSAGFMPLPPRSLAELGWFPRTLGGTLERVAGLRPASLAVVLAGLGFLLLFARNRRAWWDLSLPALVTLFVSGLRLYPFQGRTIVFLAPILHLFAGSGFEFL